MLNQENRQLLEIQLRCDKSYSVNPKIDNDDELRQFIIGLFEIVDDFNIKEPQPSRETIKEHLEEVRDYVASNIECNGKLIEDIDIEIRNQSSDAVSKTNYYDDLIKLRAAITWEE